MKLVITSDDFGVNRQRSEGIIALAQEGELSHVTALVNGEVSKEYISRFAALNLPRCSIGLHFNITEGFALSEAARACDVLTDSTTGRFKGKADVFIGLSAIGNTSEVITRAVSEELKAQLAALLSMLSKEGHIRTANKIWVDGHHHVHLLSPVFEVLVACPTVGGLRMPHQPNLLLDKIPPSLAPSTAAKQLFTRPDQCFGIDFWRRISSLALLRRSIIRSDPLLSHLATTRAFLGLDIMGSACTLAKVEEFIADECRNSEPHDDFAEIMTHAGYPVELGCARNADLFYHDEFSCSADRSHEMSVYSQLCLGQGTTMATFDECMKAHMIPEH